ncbi:MAG: EAL domain-containing protein [Parahaliea sp.]
MTLSLKTDALSPDEEALRLTALEKFHTVRFDRDEIFDTLTHLVAKYFDAPFSGISFIQRDELWIPSGYGLDFNTLPRAGAFCSYAIANNSEIFEVTNAALDGRFAHQLLVTERGIRFYIAVPLRNDAGIPIGTLWVMDTKPRNVDDAGRLIVQGLAKEVMTLLNLRYRDALTDLPNRAGMQFALESLLNERRSGVILITSIELINLRFIKNAFGAAAADQALRSISTKLLSTTENGGCCGRLGDQIFGAAWALESPGAAQAVADQLLRELQQSFTIERMTIIPQIRCGVSLSPQDGTLASLLLERSLIAIANEDANGAHRVIAYQHGAEVLVKGEAAMLSLLHDAIANDHLTLKYQPQISLLTGRVHGFEALVRLEGPDGTLIAPNRFLDLAIKHQLIYKLDLAVLRRVCRDLQHWLTQHGDIGVVSVNFSQLTLQSGSLIAEIDALLHETGVPASHLEIEITEKFCTDEGVDKSAIIAALQERGLSCAIDDFGTGVSNLEALRTSEFNTLKIDRQFIHGIAQTAVLQSMFNVLRAMTNMLGLTLIAEGVETFDDLYWLQQHDCAVVQGWYFPTNFGAENIPAFCQSIAALNPGDECTPAMLRRLAAL